MYRALIAMAISLVAVSMTACSPESSDAEVVSTTMTSSSVVTSTSASSTTTTIVEPVDVGTLMVEVLSDPALSARMDVSRVQVTPNGPVTSTGIGHVLGGDSALQLTTDLSNLTGLAIEPSVGLVGPGFVTVKESATRVIDGFVFSNQGDQWMIRLREPGDDTTVGHVLSEIAQQEWVETELVVVDGEELHRLESTAPFEFDLNYFDIDPEAVTESESSTTVYASDDGFPVIVEVDLVLTVGDADRAFWEIEYSLSQTSAESFIGQPAEAWVSIQDFSDGRFNGDEGIPIELALPTDFIPIDAEVGYAAAQSERLGGIVADIRLVLLSDPPITFDEALTSVMQDLGLVNPQSESSDFGGYPAATVTTTHASGQPVYIYLSLFSNNSGLAVLIQMLGSGDEPALERQLFDEILSTFNWGAGGGAVPGSSIGSALLQTDTETFVLTVASVNREVGCESSDVVYTEFLGSTGEEWTEDWYVSSCGALDIYPVTFTVSPGGGTDFHISSDPIHIEANAG
jgi:hypothetical protein